MRKEIILERPEAYIITPLVGERNSRHKCKNSMREKETPKRLFVSQWAENARKAPDNVDPTKFSYRQAVCLLRNAIV